MGLFDREVRTALDEMFDYDRDGFINSSEQEAEYEYLERMNNSNKSTSYDEEEEEIMDELMGMDEEEAREYLESEGYDADEFDF